MNSNENQTVKENQRSSKKILYVRGAAFCNHGNKEIRSPRDSAEYSKLSKTSLTRSVSFNNPSRKSVGNKQVRVISANKKVDELRTCKSAIDTPISKRNGLKRSKSDVSLKSNKVSLVGSRTDCNGGKIEEFRGSPNALKRRESFTRGDIMADQQENEDLNRHRKFKMDVRVSVRNDHYNQWARNKRSVSLSFNPTIRGDHMTPPNTPKLNEAKRRSLVYPRKGSETKPLFGILNFENFRTIFNDLPAGIPRVSRNIAGGNSQRQAETERPIDNDTLKINKSLHVDGIKCKSYKNVGPPEATSIPRISVGNVLEFTDKIKSDTGRIHSKKDEVEKNEIGDSNINACTSLAKIKVGDMAEIEAVFEANSCYLNVPKKSDIISSDEDFDKMPIINGKSIDKIENITQQSGILTTEAKLPIDDKNIGYAKVPFVPIKQDMTFEAETENPFVIRSDIYKLSKSTQSSIGTKGLTENNISIKPEREPRITKDGKQIKVPLKLSTREPVLNTDNVENNFARLRIEHHLNNLKMRHDSQLSARNTPVRESYTPLPERYRQSKTSQEYRYKQTHISLNDQVDFNNRHKFSEISVKIRCSADNTEKVRNTNKVGEIIPFRSLAVQRKLWNLRNTNVI